VIAVFRSERHVASNCIEAAGAGVIGKVGLAAPARVRGSHTAQQASVLSAPPNGVTWRSYYYAGSTRIAMREQTASTDVVYYLHADRFASAAPP